MKANLIEIFLSKLSRYYHKLEEFLREREENKDLKAKIKMLIFHAPLVFITFLMLPWLNPFFPRSELFLRTILSLIQCIVVRTKNFSFTMVLYLVLDVVVSLYVLSTNPFQDFRLIGIVLVQHNLLFFLTQSKLLCLIHGTMTIMLASNCHVHFQGLVGKVDFQLAKDTMTQLLCGWPLLCLVNFFLTMHLINKYSKSLQENQETQVKLKAENQELCDVNQKLRDTLSLLEKTNKELKEALSSRELFIASVSHELRNPLNSMLGNIELISLETKDSKLLSMLDSCKICGEVLLGLINNILDVAKINAEKLEISYHPRNLYGLLEKVWVVSTIKMRQKEIKGYLEIGNNVPKQVIMDSDRLNQILLNLIGNATKFTEKGFVKVRVSWLSSDSLDQLQDFINKDFDEIFHNIHRQKKAILTEPDSYSSLQKNFPEKIHHSSLTITGMTERNLNSHYADSLNNQFQRVFGIKFISHLQSKSTYIQFEDKDTKIEEKLTNQKLSRTTHGNGILKIDIIDSGCGISNKAQQDLFQPFTQADSSITRKFGGTGLGLYIVKQLIQNMGGQICLKSKEKVGSYFSLGIRIQPVSEMGSQDILSNGNLAHTSAHKIALVVDDDPLNQMIMSRYLKKFNIQSEFANNGKEALSKFKAKDPNYYAFITMDVQMPVMDGLSASKAIRRHESQTGRSGIPIIVISANCTDDAKRICLNPQGDIRVSYFFRKPFKFEECQSAVLKLLHQNR